MPSTRTQPNARKPSTLLTKQTKSNKQ
jgi:hypothetical protein